jgi:hypothetical protein
MVLHWHTNPRMEEPPPTMEEVLVMEEQGLPMCQPSAEDGEDSENEGPQKETIYKGQIHQDIFSSNYEPACHQAGQ